MARTITHSVSLSVILGCSLASSWCVAAVVPQPYIVEAHSTARAADAVRRAGGAVTHELPIVDGVAAMLSPAQVIRLHKARGVEVFADGPVVTQNNPAVMPDVYQRKMTGVNTLAAQGFDGLGVTVAILDSGVLQSGCGGQGCLYFDLNGNNRMVAQYDAIADVLVDASHPCTNSPCVNDTYGHGTHIAGLIASATTNDSFLNGEPEGIAPMVHLINVKAFDGNGTGTYTSVLNGLNWILANRTKYGAIRVVNLSFGAKPKSFYWNDPIDLAVMKLWQAGVVVVASAGNFGPKAQTIAVPGNTPYVITVGAMTDNFTPDDPSDDGVTSFSSAGPTYEGFIKPDVVAPGGHLAAFMAAGQGPTLPPQLLAATYPQFGSYDENLFIMSGTSQAAAVTTGVVALMLQANPALTPDQVKCRLIASADAAFNPGGSAAYTVFQEGAGRINALAAIYSTASNCANQGLNIAADIAGTKHFGGPARQDKTTGNFYVADEYGKPIPGSPFVWNQSFAKAQGYLWNAGYLWNEGYLWNNGYLWNAGYLWNQGYVWNNGYLWNQSAVTPASSPAAMESWNAQE